MPKSKAVDEAAAKDQEALFALNNQVRQLTQQDQANKARLHAAQQKIGQLTMENEEATQLAVTLRAAMSAICDAAGIEGDVDVAQAVQQVSQKLAA